MQFCFKTLSRPCDVEDAGPCWEMPGMGCPVPSGDKKLLGRSQGRVSALPSPLLSGPGIGLKLVEMC